MSPCCPHLDQKLPSPESRLLVPCHTASLGASLAASLAAAPDEARNEPRGGPARAKAAAAAAELHWDPPNARTRRQLMSTNVSWSGHGISSAIYIYMILYVYTMKYMSIYMHILYYMNTKFNIYT